MFVLFNSVIVNVSDINSDFQSYNKTNMTLDFLLHLHRCSKTTRIHMDIEEYTKYFSCYIKTILPKIDDKNAYILYCLGLVKERLDSPSIEFFKLIYDNETVDESLKLVFHKIYPDLPIEYMIATVLSETEDDIIKEKMLSYYEKYINGLFERVEKHQIQNAPIIHNLKADEFDKLGEYINYDDIKFDVNLLKSVFLETDITQTLIDFVSYALINKEVQLPIKLEITRYKTLNYPDTMFSDIKEFDILNHYVVYYIYQLYSEKRIDDLKRISLIWN